MSRKWYCRTGGVEHGPLSAAELKTLAESGRLKASDWVRDIDSSQWSPANKVRGLRFAAAPASESPPKPSPQPAAPGDSKTCPVCDADLPLLAVLCVQCGYDRRTGKQVSAAASEPPALVHAKAKSRSKGKSVAIAALAAICLVSVASAVGVFIKLSSKIRNPDGAGDQAAAGAALDAASVAANVSSARTGEASATQAEKQPTLPFEQAFSLGQIGWEPISNVELTTYGPAGPATQEYAFAIDPTRGFRAYGWSDRSAKFGPDATIRITKEGEVEEGILRVGDRWTFTGERWTLTAAELPVSPLEGMASALAEQAPRASTGRPTTPSAAFPGAASFAGGAPPTAARDASPARDEEVIVGQLKETLKRLPPAIFPTADERFNARLGIDAATFDAWGAALSKATGESVEREQAFQFLVAYDYPFAGGAYDAVRGKQLVARLASLPAGAGEAYQRAFEAFHPDMKRDGAPRASVVGLIVAHDPLFAGDAYLADRQAKYSARLAALDPGNVRRLAETLNPKVAEVEGLSTLELELAMSLLFADGLFVGDRPDAAAMAMAIDVAIAKKMRHEAAARGPAGELAAGGDSTASPVGAAAAPPAVKDLYELPEGSLRVIGYGFVDRVDVDPPIGGVAGGRSVYPATRDKQLVWLVVQIESAAVHQLRVAEIRLQSEDGAASELKGIGYSERPTVNQTVGPVDLGDGSSIETTFGSASIETAGESLTYDAGAGTLSFSKTPRTFGFLFAVGAGSRPQSLSIFGGEASVAGKLLAALEPPAARPIGGGIEGSPGGFPEAVELPEVREPSIPVVVASAAGFESLPLGGVARSKMRQKQVAATAWKTLLSIELHLAKETSLPADLDLSGLRLIGSHSGEFPVYGVALAGATVGDPQLRLILGDGARYAPPAGLPEKIDIKHSKAGDFQFTSASGILACKRLPGKLAVVFMIPEGSSLPDPEAEEWRLANLYGGVFDVSELVREARGRGGIAGAPPDLGAAPDGAEFGPAAPTRDAPARRKRAPAFSK